MKKFILAVAFCLCCSTSFAESVYNGVWQVEQKICVKDGDNKVCMEDYFVTMAINGEILDGIGSLVENGRQANVWYRETILSIMLNTFMADNGIECVTVRSNVDSEGSFNKSKTKASGKISGKMLVICGEDKKLLTVSGRYKLTFVTNEVPTPEPEPTPTPE